jgi:hypothetical protein
MSTDSADTRASAAPDGSSAQDISSHHAQAVQGSFFFSLPSVVSWMCVVPNVGDRRIAQRPASETMSRVPGVPLQDNDTREPAHRQHMLPSEVSWYTFPAHRPPHRHLQQSIRGDPGVVGGPGGHASRNDDVMQYLRLPSVVSWHSVGQQHHRQSITTNSAPNPDVGDQQAEPSTNDPHAWTLEKIRVFEARRTMLAGEGDKQMGFVNAYVLRSEQTEGQRWYAERTNLLAAVDALRLAKEAYEVGRIAFVTCSAFF